MYNFTFHNPTKILFGKGKIAELPTLLDTNQKILLAYGGGSIKQNGVYDQVMKALKGFAVIEFSGIEANPQYATCMKAVEVVKKEKIDFLLAVGGGSVLDAVKFVAAAARFAGKEPWEILTRGAKISAAVPLGVVLTLPATGSESNANAVISRAETGEKLAFADDHVFPAFAVLDPETTFSLPERQIANGVLDAFVHVMEQYLTFDVNAPLQDRFAEGILTTLIEEGPKALQQPQNYDVRANIMWAATLALNTLIGQGVPQDWTTHQIGHELTALHGIDHARTLTIIFPAVMKHQRQFKGDKIIQYGRRVWGITEAGERAIDLTIEKTVEFFRQMGAPVRLADVQLTPKDVWKAVEAHEKRGSRLGEHRHIGAKEIREILEMAA